MSFWKPGSKQRDQLQQSVQLNDEAIPQPLNHITTLKIAPEKDVKTSLSKGVMTMKFMKRKADADLEAITAAEKRRKMIDSSWISEANNQNAKAAEHLVCVVEETDSFSSLPGRRSFGGYNKAVERNYEQIMDEKKFNKASEKASKNSVSDAEMLARYENLIGLPRGQSQGMRPKKDRAAHLKGASGQIDKADHNT